MRQVGANSGPAPLAAPASPASPAAALARQLSGRAFISYSAALVKQLSGRSRSAGAPAAQPLAPTSSAAALPLPLPLTSSAAAPPLPTTSSAAALPLPPTSSAAAPPLPPTSSAAVLPVLFIPAADKPADPENPAEPKQVEPAGEAKITLCDFIAGLPMLAMSLAVFMGWVPLLAFGIIYHTHLLCAAAAADGGTNATGAAAAALHNATAGAASSWCGSGYDSVGMIVGASVWSCFTSPGWIGLLSCYFCKPPPPNHLTQPL